MNNRKVTGSSYTATTAQMREPHRTRSDCLIRYHSLGVRFVLREPSRKPQPTGGDQDNAHRSR